MADSPDGKGEAPERVNVAFMDGNTRPDTVPELHWHCFNGNVYEAEQSIKRGSDVNEKINLCNRQRQLIIGITPLYLAAQAGHMDLVKTLVHAGADVKHKVIIQAPDTSNVLYSAKSIAMINMHMKIWWYLKMKKNKHYKGQQDVRRSSDQNMPTAPVAATKPAPMVAAAASKPKDVLGARDTNNSGGYDNVGFNRKYGQARQPASYGGAASHGGYDRLLD